MEVLRIADTRELAGRLLRRPVARINETFQFLYREASKARLRL